MSVYDEPVYGEDILYELPGLMNKSSSPSVIFDDAAEGEGVAVDDNDLGYDDEGHEEDWSVTGAAFSLEEYEGEFERSKKKNKKVLNSDEEAAKRPSPLASAAALMGKQRISNMFTYSVFKKDIACDGIVDDVIVKFEYENFELQHDKEGYDLSWCSFKEGYLLSGSNDCKTCPRPQEKVLDATFTYEGHENIVGEILKGFICYFDKLDSRTSLFQEGEYDAVIEDKSWRLRKVYFWFYLFPS